MSPKALPLAPPIIKYALFILGLAYKVYVSPTLSVDLERPNCSEASK
jgi:hypothetical protein